MNIPDDTGSASRSDHLAQAPDEQPTYVFPLNRLLNIALKMNLDAGGIGETMLAQMPSRTTRFALPGADFRLTLLAARAANYSKYESRTVASRVDP